MRFVKIICLLFISTFLFAQDELQGCLFIDFEDIDSLDLEEGVEISDQFEAQFGLTFELEGGGFPVLAEVGGSPASAFGSAWGNDTPDPQDAALVGDFFLTDDGSLSGLTSPPVVLNFEIAIDSFAGCILDMDFDEVFKIEAYGEFGALILEDSIMAGDPGTGDGRATCWGFNFGNCTGEIFQIKFSGYRTTAGAFGLGLDNFSFCYAGVNAAVDYVICEGETLTLNGEDFTEEGSYEQLLMTDEGCDSLVFINLAVNPNFEVDEFYTICAGEVIVVNDEIYQFTGIYEQNYTTQDGCDSLVVIDLTVNEIYDAFEEWEICEGDSVIVNGVIYNEDGEYVQDLLSQFGCDSTLIVNINVNPNFEISEAYEICFGDTIEVNGIKYTESGSFEQSMFTVNGCDSLLQIQIETLAAVTVSESFSFCEGDSIIVNDIAYSTDGQFEQVFQSQNGCDSTLVLTITTNPSFEIVEEYSICDNETLELNGETYTDAGSYVQNLQTEDGCDSLITINLEVLPTFESTEVYTIFEGETININGQDYSVSGEYLQITTAVNGCDSTINIVLDVIPNDPETLVYYNLNKCGTGDNYSEFDATYPNSLACGSLVASAFQREDNVGHSCTPGINGSMAMCISSLESCTYEANSIYSIAFDLEITPDAGLAIVIDDFNFFEKAPEMFEWNNGVTGPNNYPTLFGLRIFKNGAEIYSATNLSTNRDWTAQNFDFENIPEFRFNEQGTLRFELLPYCVFENNSTVTAWDLDDIKVSGNCSLATSTVAGRVNASLSNSQLSEVEMTIAYDGIEALTFTSESGLYSFDNLMDDTEYQIAAYDNRDCMSGVSTLDLILIQKHLLGIKPFENEAYLIAADINKNDRVSASDLIELRKLILGIYSELPNNTSWRFFDVNDQEGEIWDRNESISVDRSNYTSFDFEGIKIGDVNNSFAFANTDVDNRSSNEIKLMAKAETLTDLTLTKLDVYLNDAEDLNGFQLAFDIAQSEYLEIVSGQIILNDINVFSATEELRLIWTDQMMRLETNQPLFSIVMQNRMGDIALSQNHFSNEAYIGQSLEIAGIILDIQAEETVKETAYNSFNVYPNPFSDQATIEFDNNKEEIFELNIFDVDGRMVNTQKISAIPGKNKIILRSNDFGPDNRYYLIRLASAEKSISRKVLFSN